MKLNTFFQEQKNHILTDVDKLELYQKFLYKRTSRSPVKRFSFVHARSFVYASIVAVLIFGMYGMYFFNGSITTPWSNMNTAQADYIAQVLDFDGNFSIEHQGKILKTENIGNGDTILLEKDSAMVFEINSGTKSKILGPAKLTLQKISDLNETTKYKINLIYGNFIQMEGDNTLQNVELAVDDITIKQGDKTKPINFQFINKGGNHVLKNNGPKLIITKNGDKNETQVNSKEVLAIQNNDITLYKNRDRFTVAMQKANVSQTFDIDTKYNDIKTTVSDVATGNIDEMPLSLLVLLSDNTTDLGTSTSDEAISADLSALIDTKQIPSTDQTSMLRGYLGTDTLLADIQKINDQASYDAIIQKAKNWIAQLCKTFDSKYNSDATPQQNISTLLSLLQEYEIPPTYVANLTKLSSEIGRISEIKRSTEKPTTTEDTTK